MRHTFPLVSSILSRDILRRLKAQCAMSVVLAAMLVVSGCARKESPLVLAIWAYDMDQVRQLVESGMDVNETDGVTQSALHWAIGRDQLEIAQYLIDEGANIDYYSRVWGTPLYMGLLHPKGTKFLVENGADLHIPVRYGMYPLHVSALFQEAAVTKYLIEQGAEVNAVDVDREPGVTPLHIAADQSEPGIGIVKLLISAGAKIDARCHAGTTPLHAAAHHGSLEVVTLLLENGADPGVRTNEGDTPASLARKKGHTAVAEFLEKQVAK
ncbi:ankyrin repeat domain-containing protein [Candidatus Sumerlaeota bacterium]